MSGIPDLVEKILIALAPPLATLIVAAAFGQRLSSWWTEKQKRREMELVLANSFYGGYGEFYAIWKQWNYLLSLRTGQVEDVSSRKFDLYNRSCRVEGDMEAVLLKIAAERRITPNLAGDLGNVRQSFKVLRERIEKQQPISYGASSHPDYLEFKRLATLVGNLLACRSGELPSAAESYEAFKEITDNRHEVRWRSTGR